MKNNADARTALVRKNILFSFVIKGWSALVMLLLVPITLRCLGDYTNGVWLTISSMLIWIDQMDIGLGRGLQNKLATAVAKGDYKEARKVVSNTFFMLVLIIVPIFLLLLAVINFCDVYAFLNVDETAVPGLYGTISIALLLVCSTFIFKFIGNFYMGLQYPAVSNLIVTLGATLTLALTYAGYYLGFHSLLAIAIINTASPLVCFLLAYPYTFFLKYRNMSPSIGCFDMTTAMSLFGMGVKFFVLQISAVVLFMSTNLVISKFLGPEEVTPFHVAYRYFSVIMLVFGLISTPFWSATTDAYERGDYDWIRSSSRKISMILMAMAAAIALMIVIAPWVYRIWMGETIDIPWLLTLLTGIYMLELVWSLSYSYFLNGMGVLALQLCCTLAAAILFIPLSYFVIQINHSINSVIIVMIAVNLPGLIANKIQLSKILNRTASGFLLK